MDRRAFLSSVLAVSVSGVALARPRRGQKVLDRLLTGVPVGERFYGSWELVDAYPPAAGAVTLTIANGIDSEPLRVDVCRRGRKVRAPAYTEHLELYVMDGGNGEREFPDDFVEALQHLAEAMQANEGQHYLAEELLTHRERLNLHPDAMGRAARRLTPVPDLI